VKGKKWGVINAKMANLYNPTSVKANTAPVTYAANESNFAKVLGYNSSSNVVTPNAFDRISYSNYDLPEYYRDKNLFLKETITGFLFQDLEVFTTIVLPWSVTDQQHIVWNEWKFDSTLMGRVPHEGIPRLITSQKIQKSARVVRRGLAFVMEHDFAATKDGDFQFGKNVQQIVQAIQETSSHDTVYTLLTCNDNNKRWEQMFGHAKASYTQIFEQERNEFACLVKVGPGSDHYNQFNVIIEKYKELLVKRKIIPDIILGDSQISLYLTMGDPVKTQYMTAGPDGVAMMRDGPEAMTRIRGMNFFPVPHFDVYDDRVPVNLLVQPVQTGSYNVMSFKDFRNQVNYDYTSKYRDIYVYNENKDDVEKINFKKAFMYVKVFQSNATWHPKLEHLIKTYNSEGRKPPVVDYEDEDGAYERMMNGCIDTPPPFFLATVNSNGKWGLPHIFAQLPIYSATSYDFVQVAQSILGKIGGNCTADRDTFLDLVLLLKQIENQPYNREYWLGVIKANQRFSIDERDNFVGHLTPQKATLEWGANTQLREWTPNAYGSLVLPTVTEEMGNVEFPAGYNNGPGIKTIAAEADKLNSPWNKLGERARRIEQVVNKVIAYCKQGLPTCHVLDTDSQSPWFHQPDAFTVFIENVVSVQRDPIFMAKLPSFGAPVNEDDASSVVGASGKQGRDKNDSIQWNVIPMYVVDPESEDVDAVKELIHKSLNGNIDFSEKSSNRYYSYLDPFTQQNVVVHGSFLTRAAALPRYVQAMSYMGENSIKSLAGLANVIMNADQNSRFLASSLNDNDRLKVMKAKLNKLANLVLLVAQKGKNAARNFVTQIEVNYKSVDDIVNFIDEVHVTSNSAKKQKVSRDKIKALLDQNPNYMDTDIKDIHPVQMDNNPTQGEDIKRYEEVQKMLEALYWLSHDINSILTKAGKPSQPLVLTSGINVNDMVGLNYARDTMGALYDEYNAKVKEFKALFDNTIKSLNQIKADSSEDANTVVNNVLKNASKKFSNRGKASSYNVVDSDEVVSGARFYRTPLTMSLTLLETLSSELLPLIKPSDPSTGHTTQYDVYASEDDAVHPSSVDPALWQRPNYATIDDIVDIKSKKDIKNLTFIAKHVRYDVSKNASIDSSMSARQPQKRKSSESDRSSFGKKKKMLDISMFNEDDIDDEHDFSNDYREDNYMSWNSSNRSQQQRSGKGSKMEIGAHEDDDDDDDWNADKLRRQGTRGKRVPFTNRPGFRFTQKYHDLYNPVALYRFREAEKITDPLLRSVVICALCTPIGLKEVTTMIDNNVHVPFNILLTRYFDEHDMSSIILMKGGLETGANLFGHSNFITGEDMGSKLIYGNFTCQMKPFVWRERNVLVISNVLPKGYRGGHNTDFIADPKEIGLRHRDRPSFIAMLEPITCKSYPTYICATGHLPRQSVNGESDGRIKWQFSGAEYYESIYHLGQRTDITSLANEDFMSQCDKLNIVAQPGLQFDYNNVTDLYDRVSEDKGHRGRNGSGRGAAATWNGMALIFPPQNFSEYRNK
jgi:hypothetical protein